MQVKSNAYFFPLLVESLIGPFISTAKCDWGGCLSFCLRIPVIDDVDCDVGAVDIFLVVGVVVGVVVTVELCVEPGVFEADVRIALANTHGSQNIGLLNKCLSFLIPVITNSCSIAIFTYRSLRWQQR